jgi:aldehyde:ferredoxin oxidoreductase
MYNVRQGMSRADDTLPQRFSQEPAPLYDYDLDPETGQVTASPEPIRYGQIHSLEAMLDRYYYLRQWDNQGKPTKEVLERLNLFEITNDAENI